MNNQIKNKIIPFAFSIITFFILWIITSKIINSELIIPGPKQVFFSCISFIKSPTFWLNFLKTAIRCFISFFISLILGLILGILCGEFEFVRNFLEFPLALLRTTPVIAIILISLYWLSSNTLPILISILMNLPIVITAIIQGFDSTDPKLLKMAKVYNYSVIEKIAYIKLSASVSNFKTAIFSTFSLSWKVVVAGEVLCLPKRGLGTMLQQNQIHLETASVIAITILMVLISWCLEKIIKGLLLKKWKMF